MRRFFIDREKIRGSSVTISGREAHHIRDVIRLRAGGRFLGFDGTGAVYTLRIKKAGADDIETEIEKVSQEEAKMPRVLLACAMPKKEKMDYIVEKATELGACDIIPMITERAAVRLDEKKAIAKQKRWEKIAIEASKQCGRNSLPTIYKVARFKEAVKIADDLGYRIKILPCLSEGRRPLPDILGGCKEDIAVFIGPEGDFTPQEIGYAKEEGFSPVGLGPLVLRVETACVFVLSVIHAMRL